MLPPIFRRYVFATRRFLRQVQDDFRVWRLNRDVADAFYDPLLDGPSMVRGLRAGLAAWAPQGARLRHRAFRPGLVFAPIALAVLWAVLPRDRSVTDPFGESALLSGVPAAPEAAGGPGAGEAQGSGSADGGRAGVAVQDSAEKGVNMAIMLAVAGLDSEPEAAAPDPVPVRMPHRYHALIASKRDRTLFVYERLGEGRWRQAASFPMIHGRSAGDKAEAGDRRTPEGRYWITGTLSGPSKGPLYGPLVFPLNYPTPRDLAEGKGGDGIWIHGVEAGKRPSYTRGCLALSNEDIMALADFADLGTPVVILPDSAVPDPVRQLDEEGMAREYPVLVAEHGGPPGSAEARRKTALAEAKAFLAKEAKDFPPESRPALAAADRDAILARVSKWRDDWSRRDTAAYEANYAADFMDRTGRDRAEFMARKRGIFASKRRIGMEVRQPEIKPEGYGLVSVTFRQEYEAEAADGTGVQRSSGLKTIWLQQGADGWFIAKE
jgi:murein L,D-transpeptidase YafK